MGPASWSWWSSSVVAVSECQRRTPSSPSNRLPTTAQVKTRPQEAPQVGAATQQPPSVLSPRVAAAAAAALESRPSVALIVVALLCCCSVVVEAAGQPRRQVISPDLGGGEISPPPEHQAQRGLSLPLPLPHSALALGAYSQPAERPRLIPLVAADSGYSENSSVNILCTVSQGHHETLQFEWFKDGQLLADGDPAGPNGAHSEEQQQPVRAPQIERHQDHSLLRIGRVQLQHGGRYTCAAKSQFGQDSSSVNLIVNVKLQWIKEPPKEIVVSLNQELKLDCLAQGEPKPSMRWERLAVNLGPPTQSSPSSATGALAKGQLAAAATNNVYGKLMGGNRHHLMEQQQQMMMTNSNNNNNNNNNGHHPLVSSSRFLSIQRARESDSGFYECIASNSHDADLRKLVHVQVRAQDMDRLLLLVLLVGLGAIGGQLAFGQQNGPPKILPIATADSYPEGSTINLICTVSGGQRKGLSLGWTKDGQEIDDGQLGRSEAFSNVAISQDDADISIFKIRNATAKNSGRYSCTAKNPLGQDSTSVRIVINVDMKWNKTPKDQVEVGLNQELVLECDAIGSPQPAVEWKRHQNNNSNDTHIVSKSKTLKISRAQHKDSGLYECLAHNGVHDDLRKIIQVKVRGPPKILPIATADSYPEGSTINLICTVSGGQRKGLSLGWTKDGDELTDESLRYLNLADNVSIEKTGADISILRISNATHANSGRYTCTAKNNLGEDSTSVNIVINVELKWNKLPADTELGLNQDLSIECDAIGQPQPQISWTKHPSSGHQANGTNKPVVVSQNKLLKLSKVQHKDSGLYECTARNGVDQDLRRIIQVKVRDKNESTTGKVSPSGQGVVDRF